LVQNPALHVVSYALPALIAIVCSLGRAIRRKIRWCESFAAR